VVLLYRKNGDWILENLTDKDHIRGALKAYRKATFNKWVKSTNGLGYR
jgi:predicted transglutaminase-like cysteine proteinase